MLGFLCENAGTLFGKSWWPKGFWYNMYESNEKLLETMGSYDGIWSWLTWEINGYDMDMILDIYIYIYIYIGLYGIWYGYGNNGYIWIFLNNGYIWMYIYIYGYIYICWELYEVHPVIIHLKMVFFPLL